MIFVSYGVRDAQRTAGTGWERRSAHREYTDEAPSPILLQIDRGTTESIIPESYHVEPLRARSIKSGGEKISTNPFCKWIHVCHLGTLQ